MSSAQVIELVLTGKRSGQTMLLNGHSFVNGVARVVAYPESIEPFLTLMGRRYHAYVRGSAALAAAQAPNGQNDGLLSDLQADSSPVDGAPAPVQGPGDNGAGSLPGAGTLQRELDAGSEAGGPGLVPGGAGHADAGLGQGMESGSQRESDALIRAVQEAVQKLDFRADEHWSQDGLPSVEVVAEAVKTPTLTRDMISAFCPGYTRHAAEDLAQF